jgi:hypothetical protein
MSRRIRRGNLDDALVTLVSGRARASENRNKSQYRCVGHWLVVADYIAERGSWPDLGSVLPPGD